MDQSVAISEERGIRRGVLTVLMWVFAAGALYWLLRGLEWKEFVSDLVFIDWKWVVPAVVLDVLSYVVQAARWNYVLEPLGAPPLLRSTQAIYVGLFTNEILPLRSGEFLRAFLLSKGQDLAYSVALSSVAIERLLDGIWLAIAFAVTAFFVPLPSAVRRGAEVLGIFILMATGLLVAVLAFGLRVTHALERTRAGGRGLLATLLHWIDRLFEGLQAIGHSASLYRAVAASFVLLLTQILALWAMMEAYGLSYSFWVASGVLFILHLGTAIPNAPANIGSAQLSAVAGLVLFGVDRTTATEFALVMFVILTVPLLLGGAAAVMFSGLSIGDIRRHVRRNRRR